MNTNPATKIFRSANLLAVEFVNHIPVSHRLIGLDAITADDEERYCFFCERCFEQIQLLRETEDKFSYTHREEHADCKWFEKKDCDSLARVKFPNVCINFAIPEFRDTKRLVAETRRICEAREASNISKVIVASFISDLVGCYRAYESCKNASVVVPFSSASTYGELFVDLRDESKQLPGGSDRRVYFGPMSDYLINGDYLEYKVYRSHHNNKFVRVLVHLDQGYDTNRWRDPSRRFLSAPTGYVLGHCDENNDIVTSSNLSFCSVES